MKKLLKITLTLGTIFFVNGCATPAAVEQDSKIAWEGTKKVSGEAWDDTKKVSKSAWNGTKKVSGEAWDETKKTVNNATN